MTPSYGQISIKFEPQINRDDNARTRVKICAIIFCRTTQINNN